MKHSDAPEKFMASELDLDEEVHRYDSLKVASDSFLPRCHTLLRTPRRNRLHSSNGDYLRPLN